MPARKCWSSADLAAAIAQVTPDVLALLGDGVPRAETAIVTARAGRHLQDDVRRTVMRLTVTAQLVGQRRGYPPAKTGARTEGSISA
jgi:hypothetical protein